MPMSRKLGYPPAAVSVVLPPVSVPVLALMVLSALTAACSGGVDVESAGGSDVDSAANSTAGADSDSASDSIDNTAAPNIEHDRLFIIGQDLHAIRGYVSSNCCLPPDGATAYLDFYDLLRADADFGGMGLDLQGEPYDKEADWGSGPANAYKAATEFDVQWLAIGLSITENEHPGGLDELVAGKRDAEIRQLARFAAALAAADVTILLRIGYEFDGAWNRGYDNAPRYIAAYRRIVDGMRAANVTNVQFVWQGAASSTDMVLDGGRHDSIRDWYPGDEYVDWLGLSWFMHPDEKPEIALDFAVLTPRQLSDEIVRLAREVGKPVLIAEAAPQAYDLRDGTTAHHAPVWDGAAGTATRAVSDEQIWHDWFQPLFDYMHANDDVIRGLAYINIRWDAQDMWNAPYESGYWGDTRIEASDAIARRFNAAIIKWRGHGEKVMDAVERKVNARINEWREQQ